MQARALIENASFGPDALKAMGQAFDAAWADIEGNFGEEPERVAAARLKLANVMLSVADKRQPRRAGFEARGAASAG
jgi:hypothetical protein